MDGGFVNIEIVHLLKGNGFFFKCFILNRNWDFIDFIKMIKKKEKLQQTTSAQWMRTIYFVQSI